MDQSRKCRFCRNSHLPFYLLNKNQTRHLVMICPIDNQWLYFPFEKNLNIKTLVSSKKATAPSEAEIAGQISLV